MVSVDGQNECCVFCFELFEGDEETDDRVQCAYRRYLHEDCITDIVYKLGKELFLSLLFNVVDDVIIAFTNRKCVK